MTPEELIGSIRELIESYDTPPVSEPSYHVVQPGEDLQGVLNAAALPVHLVAGCAYPGVTLPTGARLVGNGAKVHGAGKPALRVFPGTSDVQVSDLICTSDVPGAVIQLGDDDATTQGTSAKVPYDINLSHVVVPTHRGKRGIEVNATDVTLSQCEVHDVFTTTGQDSTALGILNTPGSILVQGGVYEGGSECVLFGGDTMKLADCPFISNVTFDGATFTRPASWQVDGVLRVVKNIFEIKNGIGVKVLNCVLSNSWVDGQTGFAFMLTPTRGGRVQDILIDNCTVSKVGGGLNITGSDASGIDKARTTGIVVRNSSFSISKALYGGTGRFALITAGPGATGMGSLEVTGTTVSHDGTSFVYQSGAPIERLAVTNSSFSAGLYGFNIAGGANALNWASGVADLTVTGNTISGAASALRTNLAAIGKVPLNTFV